MLPLVSDRSVPAVRRTDSRQEFVRRFLGRSEFSEEKARGDSAPTRKIAGEVLIEGGANSLASTRLRDKQVNPAEALRHHFHNLNGEHGGFLNKEQEAALINTLQRADQSGRSLRRFVSPDR